MGRRCATPSGVALAVALVACTPSGGDPGGTPAPPPSRDAVGSSTGTPTPSAEEPATAAAPSPPGGGVPPPLVALDELGSEWSAFDEACRATSSADGTDVACVERDALGAVMQQVVLDVYLAAWRGDDAATVDALAAPGGGAESAAVLQYTPTDDAPRCDEPAGPWTSCRVSVVERVGPSETAGGEMLLGVVPIDGGAPFPYGVTAARADVG